MFVSLLIGLCDSDRQLIYEDGMTTSKSSWATGGRKRFTKGRECSNFAFKGEENLKKYFKINDLRVVTSPKLI
jgi:hypothetical protein